MASPRPLSEQPKTDSSSVLAVPAQSISAPHNPPPLAEAPSEAPLASPPLVAEEEKKDAPPVDSRPEPAEPKVAPAPGAEPRIVLPEARAGKVADVPPTRLPSAVERKEVVSSSSSVVERKESVKSSSPATERKIELPPIGAEAERKEAMSSSSPAPERKMELPSSPQAEPHVTAPQSNPATDQTVDAPETKAPAQPQTQAQPQPPKKRTIQEQKDDALEKQLNELREDAIFLKDLAGDNGTGLDADYCLDEETLINTKLEAYVPDSPLCHNAAPKKGLDTVKQAYAAENKENKQSINAFNDAIDRIDMVRRRAVLGMNRAVTKETHCLMNKQSGFWEEVDLQRWKKAFDDPIEPLIQKNRS